MAEPDPEPMQAGVVNVLLTIDPVASHAAGTYLTWDGRPFDEDETARCDAATPHELWAWTVTTDEAPGAAAEPRADMRTLTTIVSGATGQAPEAFNEAVLAHFAGCRARDVLGPGGEAAGGEPGAAGPPTGETARETGPGAYRPYPAIFRETVLPRIFRETVLPGLAGQAHDEALEILGRLEPPASAPAPDATA
ncbi:MAG: hypothetical protein JWL68_4265 [Actinomycetia bacterium]|nr:hypothetical protein [Actinomycetes bacterium]